MLYAIIILSILVVILLLCIGVLLYGMKNNKKTLDGILGNDDVTEEEIISMVREGHEQGTILASEAELIHNVFEFDDKEVKDIMTHRKNIFRKLEVNNVHEATKYALRAGLVDSAEYYI